MRGKSRMNVLTVMAVFVFLAAGGWVWAWTPAIKIDLSLDKTIYGSTEPVGLQISVTNNDDNLFISKGFGSRTYYLEMRVIDPAGRLLLPMHTDFHDEFPDAPPLAWVFYNGQHLQVAGCEVLEAEWSSAASQGRIDDLRAYYDIGLPGYYSVQVQVSAVVFNGDPCDVNNYAWKGVLKSQTKFFSLQGSTEGVKVIPNQWSTKWNEPGKKSVQVHIWYEKEESVEDYQLDSIRLNNESAYQVQGLKPMIKAYFDASEALARLGDVQVGQSYTVYVSGKYSSGKGFYREQTIRIVN